MRKKHLELVQKENVYFIQINTLTGRVSLLFDHPVFNWVLAKDFKNAFYQTRGNIQLVPMLKKDLFIMEDVDAKGFRAQNFVYASDTISQQFLKTSMKHWILNHIFEFFTKSIAVFYLIVFAIAHQYVSTHYGTQGMLQLGFIFGPPAMIVLPTVYYFLWSSRTRSSILKFYFRFELMLMIIIALAYMLLFAVMPPVMPTY